MKFISTAEVELELIEDFFEGKWNEFDDQESLKQNGYLIENEGAYQAYFALSPVSDKTYWLRSLYLKEGVTAAFPLTIIETATAIAKQKGGTNLFVFSHQDSLNALLSLLQFQAEKPPAFAETMSLEPGNWWKLSLSAKEQQASFER